MEAFAKYSAIDLMIMLQVVIIWLWMAIKAWQWIFDIALRKGWRWLNRKDEKSLALDSFCKAFNLEAIQPGNSIAVKTKGDMLILVSRIKETSNG
ncbi:DUF4752 family protein [Edwardsiella tarda]|nr:DUF4752 family protein [Edwardsiella tarda]GAC64002.1 hypothetical protein ET1_08_00750 [Edwardsiella tarda ATCC 15947 = NBRC 105688]STD42426.1 Uncharacterised protein [Edwardsiella tarda]